jgi:hypothetical protein
MASHPAQPSNDQSHPTAPTFSDRQHAALLVATLDISSRWPKLEVQRTSAVVLSKSSFGYFSFVGLSGLA